MVEMEGYKSNIKHKKNYNGIKCNSLELSSDFSELM